MDANQLKAIAAGLFFLFIFLSGFWLSHSGKPYHSGIFNLHKLIGLATGVFLIVTVYRAHQAAPLGATETSAIVITILFFIATVTAGGLVSIDKPMPAIVSIMHKVFPYLTTLSTALTIYLLLLQKQG